MKVSTKGFTLIEMLLVMVIIGILAAMIVPSYVRRSEEARIKAAQGDIAVLRSAVNVFELDNGRFPASLQELLTDPKHKYIDDPNEDFLDPWGEPYQYNVQGDGFAITSSKLASLQSAGGGSANVKR